MSTIPEEAEVILGPDAAGLLMTQEEFDAIEEYDEEYRYELVNGVLVVTPIPLADETSPNDLLGHLLVEPAPVQPTGEGSGGALGHGAESIDKWLVGLLARPLIQGGQTTDV